MHFSTPVPDVPVADVQRGGSLSYVIQRSRPKRGLVKFVVSFIFRFFLDSLHVSLVLHTLYEMGASTISSLVLPRPAGMFDAE